MFELLFGWRKASKCKKLIKRVQCRLKLLKSKRFSIVRQSRHDVAQLIQYGHEEIAFNRVEQLYQDESMGAAYDMLDNFCDFIIIHLPYIRRHKDCPNDIGEAVSSLIFASARCGDLPELRVIRKLFAQRYGQRFAIVAVELYPGNLVNHQIKEKLSVKSVPYDVKRHFLDEIAREHCLKLRPLAIEYSSELQRQQAYKDCQSQGLDRDLQTKCSRTEGSTIDASKYEEPREVYISSVLNSKILPSETKESDIISTSTSSSIVLQFSSNVEKYTSHTNKKVENGVEKYSPYEEILGYTSSSESSCQFPEKMLVYLDDIEEFQSPTSLDGHSQDQRLFVFRSLPQPKPKEFKAGVHQGYMEHRRDEIPSSISHSKIKKVVGKRSRKRSLAQWQQSTNDFEYIIYYGDSWETFLNHSHKSRQPKKHQKKNQMEVNPNSYYYAQKRQKQPQCSLENPCYLCTSDENAEGETPKLKQKERDTPLMGFPIQQEKRKDGFFQETNKWETGSQSNMTSRLTNRDLPYLRAMTMPPERPKDDHFDNILRSNSCPTNSNSHVHPKLPDYDELEAKFMALKKAHLQNKSSYT